MTKLPLLCLATVAFAQTPAFEVVSVKPAGAPELQPFFCVVPCMSGERLTVTGSRVDIRYLSVSRLMEIAYRVKPYQVSGPEWMASERFDIAAKMPAGSGESNLPEMLQALLAERFKLSFHRDSKELPVYALIVGKSGPKLRPSGEADNIPLPESKDGKSLFTPHGEARSLGNGSLIAKDAVFGTIRSGRGAGSGMKMEFLQLTMPALAEVVAPHVDRPVVDMTGLKGAYYLAAEIHLPGEGEGGGRKGTREAVEPGRNGPDPFGDALFAAVDKAGLKLEARKTPVATIVVDHVEKTPTGN